MGARGTVFYCCRQFTLPFLIFTILLLAVSTNGCTTNAATGERHLNLISESQEISMGQDENKQVIQTMGLVQDQGLQNYIQSLGAKLAASSERPNLPWKYQVVDDPAVNAFAVPGGFIYVTRGILTYLNNEAELAGVMGHETGHVTARHTVNQMTTQTIAQLGMGIGMVLRPDLQQYGQLFGTGLSLLFLKFSRDDESQADHLGLRYMQRINEDPRQMSVVMTMLDEYTQASGAGGTPQWLETHPDPGNRKQAIDQELASENKNFTGMIVNRDEYLSHIDGLVFGDNPRDGYFKGTTFYQPDMKFRIDFPAGWKTQNQKQAVTGVSSQQDAALEISLAPGTNPDSAAAQFFSQQGVTAQGTRASKSIHGFPAVTGGFSATTSQDSVTGQATFLSYGGNVLQILGYSSAQGWAGYQPTIANAVNSFDRLTDPTALNVQPMHVKIVTVPRAMTIEEFASSYPSGVPVETLAIINGVEKGGQLAAGQKAKQVVGTKVQ